MPRLGLDRHQLHVVELARRAEQHAAAMRGRARRRVRRPRRVAQREIELRRMRGFVAAASAVTAVREAELARTAPPIAASSAARSAGPSNAAAASALCAFIALRWTNCRLTANSGASSWCRASSARTSGAMPNSVREEVLEMRRDGDQQVGLRLALERVRRARAAGEACRRAPDRRRADASTKRRVDAARRRRPNRDRRT